ncbi:MAG TPA: NAD(P)-binding protein [Bacillus bacterium]|nr:NAD(P)-binding protein [Bacillus sp. (in: firmicutes)]
MMSIYPIMLNLENKHCVVVGGGTVATRKIMSLLQAKANVTVVSPECSAEIKVWSKANQLYLKEKEFENGDVENAFLVIAATNSTKINKHVYEAVSSQQLINIVDQPELCNFIVPTVLNRGKLSIAISTSGGSPSLAQKIKHDLEKAYDHSYEQYIDFLDETRKEIIAKIDDSNLKYILLKHLLDPIYLDLTRQGKYSERRKYFEDYVRKEGYSL